MRGWFVFYFCIIFLPAAGKEAAGQPVQYVFRITSDSDTITLKHNFVLHPFMTDTISVAAIQQLLGAGFQMHKKSIPNRFVSGQVDTLITIRKDQSYIRLYAVSKSNKIFYEQAEIKDPLPVFKRSMRIGQTKKEIRGCLPELAGSRSIPDNILIVDENGMDYLFLSFKQDKLQKIVFQPYLD